MSLLTDLVLRLHDLNNVELERLARELERIRVVASKDNPTEPVNVYQGGNPQYVSLGGETNNIDLWSGADLILYSDSGSTEKGRWDGATGNITTAGTVDGVDVAGANAAQYVTIALDGNIANERVITAGEGIDLNDGGAGSTITIDGEDATVTNKGIASFATADFVVTSGEVTIKESGIDHGLLGGLTDDDHSQYILHSLADAASDFLVASGNDTFVKKTLAETGAILEADLDHGNLQGLDTGADHSWIDQDVQVAASPTFAGATLNGAVAIDGQVTVDTNTGSQSFYITRLGAISESLKIHVTDDFAVFESIQDENTGIKGGFVFYLDDGAPNPTFYVVKGANTLFNVIGNGLVGIAATNPLGQLHVDQSSTTAAIPVLFLDQGDVSEQCIEFSSDATDRDINLATVNVTGTPKWWWDESEDQFALTKGLIIDAGDLEFTTDGSGLVFGEIYANDVADELTIATAGQANKVQITSFAVDGLANNMTVSNANDDITVLVAGMYFCSVSVTISSAGGGGADDVGFAVYKNNGTSEFTNLHGHRKLAGGGGDRGSATMSGIIDLAVNDTIEIWVWNEDSTDNVIVDDITLSLIMIGGT